jgi:hypothetical protein
LLGLNTMQAPIGVVRYPQLASGDVAVWGGSARLVC